MALLSWKHQTLIQALMSRGPLKESYFKSIFSGVAGRLPRDYSQEFNECLLKINKELSYVQLELRCCRDQNDGEVCYGLVNNVADEQSKLGTKYTFPQIALFKGILEAIAQDSAAQGTISTIQALNIRLENQVGTGSQSEVGITQVPAALRNFSMSQKERTIAELVQDKWLCHTSDGDIGLGPRSYLDLRSWFLNSGVPSCEVCNEVALKAKCCQNNDCSIRVHEYCMKKKIAQSGGRLACSGCGIQWVSLKSEVLEDVSEITEPAEIQMYTQSRTSKSRKKKVIQEEANADDIGATSSQGTRPESKRITRSEAIRSEAIRSEVSQRVSGRTTRSSARMS